MSIDTLARTYNYTHDQAAELSVSEAMTFLLYNRHQDYLASRIVSIQSELEKKK